MDLARPTDDLLCPTCHQTPKFGDMDECLPCQVKKAREEPQDLLPDGGAPLTRTAQALAEYDAYLALGRLVACKTNEAVYAEMAEEERLGELVGIAFGLDTAHTNNFNTCKDHVRPDAWLRDLVRKYTPGAQS